ncbi:MAG: 50S ribosomal protein L24 [Gammaproteobacteria bacterium]|nr:50S ribosomal protein L24 [Gammaproteobacteria bacterium]
MNRLKKGDDVIVIAGKNKSQRGTVLEVFDNGRVLVENINMVKKHVKPNPQKNEQGGIIEKEMPINASNIMIFNPQSKKGDRIGYKTLDDGRKVRYFKSNNEVVDV